jgi:hypothetical protein
MEKDFRKVLSQLVEGNPMNVNLAGSDINIRVIDQASKLSLTTSVYYGGNYIPPGVRQSLNQHPIKSPPMPTFLTVDEQNFQINLNYLGHADLSQHHFQKLLEEFGVIAEKWRLYLDEHDKNDLIYVRKFN